MERALGEPDRRGCRAADAGRMRQPVAGARCRGGACRAHPLADNRGKRLRVHSVEDARLLLQAIPLMSMNLVHWSVQDEMCGMCTHPEEDLKVPISQRSAW